MSMTLEQVLQASAAEIEFLATKDQLNVTDHDRHLRLLASLRNAITHLTQPAQSVDDGTYEAIGKAFREVLSDPAVAWRDTGAKEFIARVGILTAALTEKGNGSL